MNMNTHLYCLKTIFLILCWFGLTATTETKPDSNESIGASPSNSLQPRPRQQSKAIENAKNLASGIVGGVASVYSGQPLDKLKVLLQTGQVPNMKAAIRQLYSQGLFNLYSGATASLASEVSVNAIAYASFQAAKTELKEKGMSEDASILLAGGFAGAVVSGICSPLELIKIRLQTQADGKLKGPWDCVRHIVRQEGPMAMLNGMSATTFRTVPLIAVFFSSYTYFMEKLKLDPLLSGGFAGMAAWSVALPLDTIKSRVQNSTEMKSFATHFLEISKNGGLPALYKGFGPVMLRAFWANACCFKALEVTKAAMDRMTPEEYE